jgi:hypothetical protein
VAPYVESEYYSTTVDLEGDKLKAALHNIIAKHHRQEMECLPMIFEAYDDAGAGEFEYLWPKEIGFPDDIQDAYTDAHNLWHSIMPPELIAGIPRDDYPAPLRGDYARTLFYMAVRYQGNDSSLTPDLELVSGKPEKGTPYLGGLCQLLDWHQSDPVSEQERRRNERIYEWQGNRNPFVDQPAFAAAIWESTCLGDADKTARIRSVVERLEEMEMEIITLKRQLLEMMSTDSETK